MALKAQREDVWVASITDTPGGLAEKLDKLSAAGASLEFLIARRSPDTPGTGVVFVTPLKGAKQLKAAKAAGFRKTAHLQSIKVEGADKPGLGAKITQALAEAGVNLRGFSGAAVGKKCVMHIAVDSAADAKKAVRALKKV